MSTVDVQWKCKCMTEEATLLVPERLPALDVVAWVRDVVSYKIAAAHRRLAPTCWETTMEFVKLPVPPSGLVGGSQLSP